MHTGIESDGGSSSVGCGGDSVEVARESNRRRPRERTAELLRHQARRALAPPVCDQTRKSAVQGSIADRAALRRHAGRVARAAGDGRTRGARSGSGRRVATGRSPSRGAAACMPRPLPRTPEHGPAVSSAHLFRGEPNCNAVSQNTRTRHGMAWDAWLCARCAAPRRCKLPRASIVPDSN
jgi:hypothetical protein